MFSFAKLATTAVLAALSLGTLSASASPLIQKRACAKYLDAAKGAAQKLQSTYFINGQYDRNQQWVWISANDNYWLRQLDELTGEGTYTNVIDTVFNGWEDWFVNGGSYDDLLWVVLSYLKSGNVEAAKHYFELARVGEDPSGHCGGGIFWSKARDYKNAITNELYIAAAGALYDATRDQQYLDKAKANWAWFKASKLRSNDNGLYNDGLVFETCENNRQTQWTYNQGVILLGLGYLAKHDPEGDYADWAFGIMDALIHEMSVNGGIKEVCDSPTPGGSCNLDQQTFKGILMMHMSLFLNITGRDSSGKFADYVHDQADRIIANAANAEGFYGSVWFAPNEGGSVFSMQTQGSALGGLVAAAMQNC